MVETTGSSKILVFSAHGADWCSRSGGSLAAHAQRGAEVHVVALTYGERGESGALWRAEPNISRDEVKVRRRAESEEAARILGVNVQFLDWGDYPLFIDKERLLHLVELIREIRPNVILTHWTSDPFNQDHQVTGLAVIRACHLATAAGVEAPHAAVRYPSVYLFESSVPMTEFNGFNPDTFVDVTPTYDQKMEALRAFKAQPELAERYGRYVEQRGEQARTVSGRLAIRYAEGFKSYRPAVVDQLT